jgi:hypothetical protein
MIAIAPTASSIISSKIIVPKTISGTVIDKSKKVILHGATIHIWNTTNRSKVELNGEFSIDIPEYLQSDVLILEVKFSQYDSKIISFKANNLMEFLTIELEPKTKHVKSSGKSRWKFFS